MAISFGFRFALLSAIIISGVLDVGTALMTFLICFVLGHSKIKFKCLGGNEDEGEGCHLASCLIAKGVQLFDYPVYSNTVIFSSMKTLKARL